MELQGAGSDWVLTLTQGAITPARKPGLDFSSDWETLELSRPIQPNGVVCNILVKICQDQKQLEHPVSLLRIGIGGAFLEILDDGQSVSQEPFKISGVHGVPVAAAIESIIGAHECLVEKMIEAKLLAYEGSRN
jgi:hypothetical protein